MIDFVSVTETLLSNTLLKHQKAAALNVKEEILVSLVLLVSPVLGLRADGPRRKVHLPYLSSG